MGVSKCNKQQLLAVLGKAKKLLFKKDDLQKLQKKQLRNIAKEHNIKVTFKTTKAKIIEAILKTQDSVFCDIVANEFKFHDDVITLEKEERKPAYASIERRSRFIKKFNATEVDYAIKINKIIEVENAIYAVIKHANKEEITKKVIN